MKMTDCWGVAVDIIVGLSLVEERKIGPDQLNYTANGIEIVLNLKGQDYVIQIQPKENK